MPIGSFPANAGVYGFPPMTPHQQPVLPQWGQGSPPPAQQTPPPANDTWGATDHKQSQPAAAAADPWSNWNAANDASVPGAWVDNSGGGDEWGYAGNSGDNAQVNNTGGDSWGDAGNSGNTAQANDTGGDSWENGGTTDPPAWESGGDTAANGTYYLLSIQLRVLAFLL